MASLGQKASESERIAAVSHDFVEDCEVSLQNLRKMGFPEEIVEAVDALTKQSDEKDDSMRARRRVAQNPVGKRVKIGDLGDNMDLSRLLNPTENDRAAGKVSRGAAVFDAILG